MSTETSRADLSEIRRRLHRHPEPGWLEYQTTAAIIEKLRELDVDSIYIGSDAYPASERLGVPDETELSDWRNKAREAGVDTALLDQMAGGETGVVAVVEMGTGPTVGLRVDIDGLQITESDAEDHRPAVEGFRSRHDGVMHACGHDAHTTIGLGVIEELQHSDFDGTLKVFFQPAEEGLRGGHAMAASEHLEDVDRFFGVHIGLDHPTGEVVAGMKRMLASSKIRARFIGTSSHAGKAPQEGDNAVQAMATAIQNLYAIPRHGDGATRINVGVVEGGSAINIIPEEATIAVDIRGITTELMEYMESRSEQILRSAAQMHGCTVELETIGKAPRVDSDPTLARTVAEAADRVEGVDTVSERGDFNASEDATHLMQRVKENGGQATYLVIGTDHPTGHHTSTFDIDERSLGIGVEVLSKSIEQLSDGEERG